MGSQAPLSLLVPQLMTCSTVHLLEAMFDFRAGEVTLGSEMVSQEGVKEFLSLSVIIKGVPPMARGMKSAI